MASLVQMGSPLIYSKALAKTTQRPQPFTCTIVAKTTPGSESPSDPRRSANYRPSLWDHHHLLSVKNKYTNIKSVRERDLLKETVRKMLDHERSTHVDQLELIDDLQKLGVSYHFEQEIDNMLTFTYHKLDKSNFMEYDMEYDLHANALKFRLLRQHGFNVSEDVFDVFHENCGKFESGEINGFISLYEASYLSTKSDTKLQNYIRFFATQQLRDFVDTHSNKNCASFGVGEMVAQALDMPYHWRMRRLATRSYINLYGMKPNKNPVLVELAKLDFNIVQAVYQEELKYVSSWWRETGLANQLHFSRDRIVENYFWTIGQIQEPQFGYVRRIMAKLYTLLTTIDDIYDIYGTLEELQLFTAAFASWDVNRLDELPEYMRLCFLVVYNEVNSIGCDILRNKNINVIPFLRKSWADVSNAFLIEAIWYKRGHKPNTEEYMQNAWKSIGVPTICVHFYCVFSDQLSVQVLETLSEHLQDVVRCSAFVVRLANDLVTSQSISNSTAKKTAKWSGVGDAHYSHQTLYFLTTDKTEELERGDVLKSIQCYMNETGASQEKACVHVQQIINDMWDEMNYEKTKCRSLLIPQDFVESVMNLARMSQCMYQYGDGHGSPEKAKIVDSVMSLLFNPIILD